MADDEELFCAALDYGKILYRLYGRMREKKPTLSFETFLMLEVEWRKEEIPDDAPVAQDDLKRIVKLGFIVLKYPQETEKIFASPDAMMEMKLSLLFDDDELLTFYGIVLDDAYHHSKKHVTLAERVAIMDPFM
jgi:hypothetical protein